MMKTLYLFLTAVLFCPLVVPGQDSGIPLQSTSYHLIDRLDILGGASGFLHTEIKPFSRRDAAAFAMHCDTPEQSWSKQTRSDLQYLFNDNQEWVAGVSQTDMWQERQPVYTDSSRTFYRLSGPDGYTRPRVVANERPVFGIFYRTPANFFEVNTPFFRLKANPLLNVHLARDVDSNQLLFANQRGIEIRGDVDRRVYFYTSILETQERFASYVDRRINQYDAVPGALRYKDYKSQLFGNTRGYDFNVAQAFIGFYATRHIGVQFGHGRQFIGNGYRSVFLSDFGPPRFFLQISTKVWRFHYQNLFFELNPTSADAARPNRLLPKKYAAVHYLNFKATPRLSFGFFEATVFNRSGQFELQYLNPIILYRTVEAALGSPDNVLIGFDGKWNLFRRVQFYGQFLFDEFRFDALYQPRERGWWGNKFAWQLGGKYVDAFGIDHLDLQIEWNAARPYTWSHRDSLNSWTHYNQTLGHPLGANFKELVGLVRYQPCPRLSFNARIVTAQQGDDTVLQNWGADPLRPNRDRVQDYGNSIGQGVRNELFIAGLDVSWALYHNLFIDANLMYRQKNSLDDSLDERNFIVGGGIRLNIWRQALDF